MIQFILDRGIAQLAARCVWDAEVPSSSLGTPTDLTTCGYGVMVARDPSKVSVRVRISLPANKPHHINKQHTGL